MLDLCLLRNGKKPHYGDRRSSTLGAMSLAITAFEHYIDIRWVMEFLPEVSKISEIFA